MWCYVWILWNLLYIIWDQIGEFILYYSKKSYVKTQIYSALSVYLIVALLKYNLNLQHNLYEILQILSVSLLVKEPINELFKESGLQKIQESNPNQLKIW